MFDLIDRLLEKTSDIKRSTYIWNAINAILSALQCPVSLIFISGLNGLNDAGLFSIAFAIANLMLYIGLYGLRRYQASDINENFSFSEYNGMRYITCGVMLAAVIGYLAYGMAFNDYSIEKSVVILLVCMLKEVQAYTDVIHGNMQQKGRLDVAAKSSAVRYVLEVVAIVITLYVTHDILISVLVSVIVSLLVMALTTINSGRKYCDTYVPKFRREAIRALAIDGAPLFASLFLNMYISNAPKYAIDRYLGDEVQAVYNFIFMPAFMVMLLSNFIFNPIIKSYAELWLSESEEKLKLLKKKIGQQMVFIAGLTVLGLAVAATIGIPVIGFIFSADLTEYKRELCIVMIGGGALAYATYFSTILTIIRKQKSMIICYGIAALAAWIMSGILVSKYGIAGATVMYSVIMILLALLLGIIVIRNMKISNKKAEV